MSGATAPVPYPQQPQQFQQPAMMPPPGYYMPQPGMYAPIPAQPVAYALPVQAVQYAPPMPTVAQAEQALGKAEASVAAMGKQIEAISQATGDDPADLSKMMGLAQLVLGMVGQFVLGTEKGRPVLLGETLCGYLIASRRKAEAEAAKAELEAYELHRFMERKGSVELLLDVKEQELRARLLTAQRKNSTANRPPFKPAGQGNKPQHKHEAPTPAAPVQAAQPSSGATMAQAKGAEKIAALQQQLAAAQAEAAPVAQSVEQPTAPTLGG